MIVQSHTLKLPLLLRFLFLGWITTALLFFTPKSSTLQASTGGKFQNTSQGTSPGRTAWLITVITLMGEDYLIETTGHLSHPTHRERLTACPQGCYLAALQSLCLGTSACKCSCSCSLGRGDSRTPVRPGCCRAGCGGGQSHQVCHLQQGAEPSSSPEAPWKSLQDTAQYYQMN